MSFLDLVEDAFLKRVTPIDLQGIADKKKLCKHYLKNQLYQGRTLIPKRSSWEGSGEIEEGT